MHLIAAQRLGIPYSAIENQPLRDIEIAFTAYLIERNADLKLRAQTSAF